MLGLTAPGVATRMYRWFTQLDVRSILSAISVPTVVLHRQENQHYRPAYGRYLAEHVPGARTELSTRRELATVLFTDSVGSTDLAARLGDARRLELRSAHDEIVRRHLAALRGTEISTTGDGFLATFDGPARAVHCASRIADSVRALGLEVRAGLHTGEIELLDHDIGGIAVHLAARILAAARPSEVLVSSTLTELAVGSGIAFVDRGVHELKGIPGTWHLFGVGSLP